jgi:hypothetical protein
VPGVEVGHHGWQEPQRGQWQCWEWGALSNGDGRCKHQRQDEEIVRTLCITGGAKGNGGAHQCASLQCLGEVVIIKNLYLTAKLEMHGGEIRARLACNDGGGTKCVGDAY